MNTLIEKRWLRAVALFALVLGVFFAVKALDKKVEVKEVQTMEIWYFNGTSYTLTDFQNPSNYVKYISGTHSCDNKKEIICQIEAPSNGNELNPRPELNTARELDIEDVFNSLPNSFSQNTTVLEVRSK